MLPSRRRQLRNPGRVMLTWAIDEHGVIHTIEEVPLELRERERKYRCAQCDGTLTPHRGKVNRHHFKHPAASTCPAAEGGSGAIHLNALLLLQRELRELAAAGGALQIEAACPQCQQAYGEESGRYVPPSRNAPPRPEPPARFVRCPPLQMRAGDVIQHRHELADGLSPDLSILRDGKVVAAIEIYKDGRSSEQRWDRLAAAAPLVLEVKAWHLLEADGLPNWDASEELPVTRATGTTPRCPPCEDWWQRPYEVELSAAEVEVCLPEGRKLTGHMTLLRRWVRGTWGGELRIKARAGATFGLVEHFAPPLGENIEGFKAAARQVVAAWKDRVEAELGARPRTISESELSTAPQSVWTGTTWVKGLSALQAYRAAELKRAGARLLEVKDATSGAVFYSAEHYARCCRWLDELQRSRPATANPRRRRGRRWP